MPPPGVSPPKPDAELKLKAAIGDATLNWGELENTLAVVLNGFLHGAASGIGFAIYFAPTNTETRLYIVDHALQSLLRPRGGPDFKVKRFPLAEELTICWRDILDKINKAKETRNKIAHGHITNWVTPRNKTHVVLTASINDWQRFGRTIKPRQVPGMSANDIQTAANNFLVIAEHLKIFSMIIRDLMLIRFDEPAFQERVRALAIRLRTSVPSLGVRFEKGLQVQP